MTAACVCYSLRLFWFFHHYNTEIKRDNDKIHKSLTLQMQMCRQEIVEHVRQLKTSVIRLVNRSTNGAHHKVDNDNDLPDRLDVMDEDNASQANDDDEFHRWSNAVICGRSSNGSDAYDFGRAERSIE